MTPEITSRYEAVRGQIAAIALLSTTQAALEWDERTMLPPAAGEYRAEQAKLLAGLIHQRWTDPKLSEDLAALTSLLPPASDADPAAADIAISVERLKRKVDKKLKLPQSLVEALAHTAVVGQQIWQEAREKSDFAAFRPLLERTLQLKRQEADALGYPECRYDALLDDYEPYERTSNVARVLADLRQELVPLVGQFVDSSRRPKTSMLHAQYAVDRQEALGRRAAAAIGFDFRRGRLDVTAHPFCTTLGPHDCRITTRYDATFFNSAFFGILHEAGHGIYEQGLPPEHFGMPLGEAISLGVHESQSRLWENQVGRSPAFWRHFFPLAQQAFTEALAGVADDDFLLAINQVRPSLVRVEADEATYNLHIIVRFELEQAMLNGDLPLADLPAAWNDAYRRCLGVVPADDAQGVLQDVHWSAGLIGYFPTYTLGNLYAAQFFAQAEADVGPLDEQFARGESGPLRNWLRERIHRHGQRFTAAELVRQVTGQPLSSAALVGHLRKRLGPLYGLS